MTAAGSTSAIVAQARGDMLAWLTERAQAAAPCPTNDEICRRFGFASKATAVAMIDALEKAGAITRFRLGNARQIRINATGQMTGVGGQNTGSREGIGNGGKNAPKWRADRALAEAFPIVHPVPEIAIDRTPCPRCGIRADVGCKHQRAAVA